MNEPPAASAGRKASAPLRLIKIGTLIFSPDFATVRRSKERAFEQKEKVHKHFPPIPMKSSTDWHGHSIRPSLPVGTARKVKENLLHGRRNRLIIPPAKRNSAFPTGNALLYISLLYVVFGRVRPIQGRALFFCFAFNPLTHGSRPPVCMILYRSVTGSIIFRFLPT